MKMLHSSQFLIRDVCLCVCAEVIHLACRSTCFSYTLTGAMSLLKHHLFIWQSLLFVIGNMRSEASEKRNAQWGLSLPANITDQQQFSKRQAWEAQICDVSVWCNYSSFYLRELLRHLINTTDIGESERCSVLWQWRNEMICQGRCESNWVLRLIVTW